MEDIPLLPVIPEQLRIAATRGTLLPFVGAGVSLLAGCPGWDDFASKALEFFVDQGRLNFAQFEQLKALPARARLSIAIGLEKKHDVQIDFKKILEGSSARAPYNNDGRKIYADLRSLAKTFITTNYDEWLVKPLDEGASPATVSEDATASAPSIARTPYYDADRFTSALLTQEDAVIHIHGSVLQRESMVLTASEYLRRYANHAVLGSSVKENNYLNFLGHAFRTRNILFVGYGLAELEILEYVIQKASKHGDVGQISPEAPRHFMLQGFYTHQAELMRSLSDYYAQQFNVLLLPFAMDQRGWRQLIDVVEFMSKEIPTGETLTLEKRRDMERLLDD